MSVMHLVLRYTFFNLYDVKVTLRTLSLCQKKVPSCFWTRLPSLIGLYVYSTRSFQVQSMEPEGRSSGEIENLM